MARKDDREKHEFDTYEEACAFAEGVEYAAFRAGGWADAEVRTRRQRGKYVVMVDILGPDDDTL